MASERNIAKEKILIIRFSSIGDIVLTTPIVRALKNQGNYCIHYLIKEKFKHVLDGNEHLEKIFCFEDEELKSKLQQEKYSLVIDLQNNLKSLMIRKNLSKKTYVVNKENLKKLLLVRTGIDLLNQEHIVTRYFKTIKKLGIKDDGMGLDFFIPKDFGIPQEKTPIELDKPFVTWVIGASYPKKTLTELQIAGVCSTLNMPFVLLGGPLDKKRGDLIESLCQKDNTYNLCGKLSLQESAFFVKKSALVLTNDTGMMHIAAAMQKQIISFWGCTKPSLGMYPFRAGQESIMLVSETNKAPCSKLGNRCKSSRTGCIKDISEETITKSINKLLR